MNIYDLVIQDKEKVQLDDVFLSPDNFQKVDLLIKENKYSDELKKYNLPINHKIMLQGSSGCGKTMTAKAIAQTLGKQILIVNLSNIISSRIGETSQNMKLLFDKAAREKAVLFIDEFDQLARARVTDEKDVGEMRRLVNTVIQLIDYLPETALLIGATNHPEIIDNAILRRFQLHMNFEMPHQQVLDSYYDTLLATLPDSYQQIERKYGLSFAQAKDYTFTLVKSLLIADLELKESLQLQY